MLALNQKEWITTDRQLRRYLKRCHQCFIATSHGKYVMPYNLLSMSHLKRKQYSFILNTINSTSQLQEVGHWFNFHINNITKQAILHDSLDEIEKSHREVFEHISQYCKKMNLNLHIYKLRTQSPNNLTCGIQSLWFNHKCHMLNIHGLLKLKQAFKNHSVYSREKFIVTDAVEMFHIWCTEFVSAIRIFCFWTLYSIATAISATATAY